MEPGTSSDASIQHHGKQKSTKDSGGSDEGVITPVKQGLSQRTDGHFATPVKKRLKFSYWAEDEEKVPTEISIKDLKEGNYLNQVLRFRVAKKAQLKKCNSGNMLSFLGMDSTGEILFFAFRSEAEKFDAAIQMNTVYKLENFAVKAESDNFTKSTGRRFIITLNSSSVIVKEENDKCLPPIPFNFIPLLDVTKMKEQSRVDVLGVIVQDWGCEPTRAGVIKRDFSITDQSKETVMMTLWGARAQEFLAEEFSIVAIRKGTVSKFLGDVSLNCNFETLVWVNPNIREAEEIKKWFKGEVKKKKATTSKKLAATLKKTSM